MNLREVHEYILAHQHHPVIETYLAAFYNFETYTMKDRRTLLDSIENAEGTVEQTMQYLRMNTEHEDEEGNIIPTPDYWKAELVIEFADHALLYEIVRDIEEYKHNPTSWQERQ